MPQREFLRNQPAQRLAEHVRRGSSRNLLQPIGHIVGHVCRGVRIIPALALPNVVRIKSENPKTGFKIMLGSGESPMIGPKTAQKHERNPMVADGLVEEAASLHDGLGHVTDRKNSR